MKRAGTLWIWTYRDIFVVGFMWVEHMTHEYLVLLTHKISAPNSNSNWVNETWSILVLEGARSSNFATAYMWVEIRSSERNPWDMTQMVVIPSQKWLTADPALVRPNRRACSQVLHTTSIKQVFSKCFIIFKTVFLFVRLDVTPNPPDVDPNLDRKAVRDQNIRTQNTTRLAISQGEQTNSCSS